MILHVHVEFHWAYYLMINPLLYTDAMHPRPSCVFFFSEDEPQGEKRRQLHKNISVMRAAMQMCSVGLPWTFSSISKVKSRQVRVSYCAKHPQ